MVDDRLGFDKITLQSLRPLIASGLLKLEVLVRLADRRVTNSHTPASWLSDMSLAQNREEMDKALNEAISSDLDLFCEPSWFFEFDLTVWLLARRQGIVDDDQLKQHATNLLYYRSQEMLFELEDEVNEGVHFSVALSGLIDHEHHTLRIIDLLECIGREASGV